MASIIAIDVIPMGTPSAEADVASDAASLAAAASTEAFGAAVGAPPETTLSMVPPLDLPRKLNVTDTDGPRFGTILLAMLP